MDQFARRLVARDGSKVDVVTGAAEALVQGGKGDSALPAGSVEVSEVADGTIHGGQRIVDDL